MAYETLAASYDRLTGDIPYEEILGFYEKLLARFGVTPLSAVELACGTGTMALLLANKGLRVTAADASEEMLTQAYEKAMEAENPPYFIRQRMERLRLPVPVDLAVCCLDGINYLTKPEQVRQTFRRVKESLNPGGLFIFDINSEAKLRSLDGQIFLDEDDDVFCLWRAEYDAQTRLCRYGIDLFRRQGALWQRSREEHLEYAYRESELRQWLEEAGFRRVLCCGDRRMEPPGEHEQRIFFAAQA